MNSKNLKKIRVLHVISNLAKGGAQRLAIDISNELNRRENVETLLVYLNGDNEFPFLTEEINIKKCPASVQPSLTGKSKIDIDSYEDCVSSFKPDIIHSHLYSAELVVMERHRCGIKYFTHCHDNIRQLETWSFNTFRSRQKLVEYYERCLLIPKYISADSNFITISEDTQRYFHSVLPPSLRKNIFLLHNAINVENFKPTREAAINNNKIDEPVKLINVGNLIEKKNQIFLLDIVENLKKENIKVHLKIVGDGTEGDKISKTIKTRNLTEEIQMTGSRDDVAELLSQSSIYVHTALYEPFGLVLIEAMAVGLPVISLDGRGNKDVIKDGKNGYLIPAQNPRLFTEKIKYLINNKDAYDDMSGFAVEYAKQNYDIGSYVDKLLEIYEKKLYE